MIFAIDDQIIIVLFLQRKILHPLCDNSIMENFFGLLKQEIYYGTTYYSYDELKKSIEKYIVYYNEKRIRQKLGWMSPVEYRLSALTS